MSKTNVRIGAFEIDDAELHGEHQGERTLSIPCKSDPDLCMQLDAWDADTSVPAILNGEHSVLYRKHYDRQSDAWARASHYPFAVSTTSTSPAGGLPSSMEPCLLAQSS